MPSISLCRLLESARRDGEWDIYIFFLCVLDDIDAFLDVLKAEGDRFISFILWKNS